MATAKECEARHKEPRELLRYALKINHGLRRLTVVLGQSGMSKDKTLFPWFHERSLTAGGEAVNEILPDFSGQVVFVNCQLVGINAGWV